MSTVKQTGPKQAPWAIQLVFKKQLDKELPTLTHNFLFCKKSAN